jgi:hypothetical protein
MGHFGSHTERCRRGGGVLKAARSAQSQWRATTVIDNRHLKPKVKSLKRFRHPPRSPHIWNTDKPKYVRFLVKFIKRWGSESRPREAPTLRFPLFERDCFIAVGSRTRVSLESDPTSLILNLASPYCAEGYAVHQGLGTAGN